MNKPFSPIIDPEIHRRITEAVTFLEVPAPVLLHRAHSDLHRQVETQRSEIELFLVQTHGNALAALARILMRKDDLQSLPGNDYFNRPMTNMEDTEND